MAQQTATAVSFVEEGVSRENIQYVNSTYTGTWANGDTMAVQVPNYKVDGGLGITGYAVWTDGAGSPGARARTYQTAAHVPLTSFDESTGIAVFTNSLGSGITNPKFSFILVATV